MRGYALAVFKFRGRNALFALMIGSMMIPPVLTLIPYYIGTCQHSFGGMATFRNQPIRYLSNPSIRRRFCSEGFA